jgi:hypothetical protein
MAYKLEKITKNGVQTFWLIRNQWTDASKLQHTKTVAVCYSLAIAHICYEAVKGIKKMCPNMKSGKCSVDW